MHFTHRLQNGGHFQVLDCQCVSIIQRQAEARHKMLLSWWRHQMEPFSALLAICAGNSPVPVNSPHKGQWHGALMFSLICVWINGWVNNHEASDYDVIVMWSVHRIVQCMIIIHNEFLNAMPSFLHKQYEIMLFRSAETGYRENKFWELGWGLLSQFPPFRYFPIFSVLRKHTLSIEYYVYFWQESPQLSCQI